MRRLAHALGALAAAIWIAFVLYDVLTMTPPPAQWAGPALFLTGGGLASYATLWGAVRLADWVWRGFQDGAG